MNILHPFRKEITRQLQEYVEWKASAKGTPISIEHKECLLTFIAVNHLKNVNDLVIEHVYDYKDWLLNRYGNTYTYQKNMHVIQCFLRFYRKFAIIADMNKLGRKPDYMMIAKVKKMRSEKKKYKEIISTLKKEDGRKFDQKQIYRWIYAKI